MKLALLVLLLCGCASMGTSMATSGQFNRASSVRVSTNQGHGSGVVVSSKCVLTADHVVKDAKQINTGVVMHIVKQEDDPVDLALICADAPLNMPAVKLGDVPQIDDYVYVVGDPIIYKGVVTEGRYEDTNMITAHCAPGNSGGGVFNKAGELVGVADAITGYPGDSGVIIFPNLCEIVGIDTIKDFLKGAI